MRPLLILLALAACSSEKQGPPAPAPEPKPAPVEPKPAPPPPDAAPPSADVHLTSAVWNLDVQLTGRGFLHVTPGRYFTLSLPETDVDVPCEGYNLRVVGKTRVMVLRSAASFDAAPPVGDVKLDWSARLFDNADPGSRWADFGTFSEPSTMTITSIAGDVAVGDVRFVATRKGEDISVIGRFVAAVCTITP